MIQEMRQFAHQPKQQLAIISMKVGHIRSLFLIQFGCLFVFVCLFCLEIHKLCVIKLKNIELSFLENCALFSIFGNTNKSMCIVSHSCFSMFTVLLFIQLKSHQVVFCDINGYANEGWTWFTTGPMPLQLLVEVM